MSFPAGSAAGTDGIRPQRLLELVQSREAGPQLLTSVTAFANLLLADKCHSDYLTHSVWRKTVGIRQKVRGIRAIVVGYVTTVHR